MSAFKECETCRSKPGMPSLCEGCLHNRRWIEYYEEKLEKKPFYIQDYLWLAWLLVPTTVALKFLHDNLHYWLHVSEQSIMIDDAVWIVGEVCIVVFLYAVFTYIGIRFRDNF